MVACVRSETALYQVRKGVIFMTIDAFKRALIITATQFNDTDGSVYVSGLTPTAADTLQRALKAEPYVGVHIKNFNWNEQQGGMTMLAIYPQNRGRFHEQPSFNLLLGICLGMYLDVNSFSDTWKAYVKRLMGMIPG